MKSRKLLSLLIRRWSEATVWKTTQISPNSTTKQKRTRKKMAKLSAENWNYWPKRANGRLRLKQWGQGNGKPFKTQPLATLRISQSTIFGCLVAQTKFWMLSACEKHASCYTVFIQKEPWYYSYLLVLWLVTYGPSYLGTLTLFKLVLNLI